MTDALLAVRCQLGDADAFDELVARFHPPLYAYVRRVAGDTDAADVTQDVWVRVVRGLPRLREPERLRAWLFGIAHRALMDRLRSRYGTLPLDQALDTATLPAPDDDDTIEEMSATLERAVDQLPMLEREVISLFYLRELTLADIAGALDVPVGTVKSRLHRARRLLRAAMENTQS